MNRMKFVELVEYIKTNTDKLISANDIQKWENMGLVQNIPTYYNEGTMKNFDPVKEKILLIVMLRSYFGWGYNKIKDMFNMDIDSFSKVIYDLLHKLEFQIMENLKTIIIENIKKIKNTEVNDEKS